VYSGNCEKNQHFASKSKNQVLVQKIVKIIQESLISDQDCWAIITYRATLAII